MCESSAGLSEVPEDGAEEKGESVSAKYSEAQFVPACLHMVVCESSAKVIEVPAADAKEKGEYETPCT